MLQEDNEAAELQPAEEVAFVMFPTADQSAEVVEPRRENVSTARLSFRSGPHL
jgi:hypothetical protein